MTTSLLLSMSAFALVASISPGPVNILCLSCGSRYPLFVGLRFVTGATLGFIVLFLAIGAGLYSLLEQFPTLNLLLHWAGVGFLLYLSARIFFDDGRLPETDNNKRPGFMTGATMQWLNPKAWLASVSGIGAYTSGGDITELLWFAGLYLPICWLSLGCWVYAGGFLRRYVSRSNLLVPINRVLAVLLAVSCLFLLSD